MAERITKDLYNIKYYQSIYLYQKEIYKRVSCPVNILCQRLAEHPSEDPHCASCLQSGKMPINFHPELIKI